MTYEELGKKPYTLFPERSVVIEKKKDFRGSKDLIAFCCDNKR